MMNQGDIWASERSHLPIFSGDASRKLWDAINALKDEDVRYVIYYLGCKLQELESRIEKIDRQPSA